MVKPNEKAKHIAKMFSDSNFSCKIYIDKQGEPIITYAWGNDIVISKIDIAKRSDNEKTIITSTDEKE